MGKEGKYLPISHCSPVYPSGHEQLYLLTSSLHVPEFRHGEDAHSLISIIIQTVSIITFCVKN